MGGLLWFVFLFLVVPATGLTWYLRVLERMERERVPDPPRGSLFFVFAAYGLALLYVVSLLNGWSGMHLAGSFVLIVFVTPTLWGLAWSLRKERRQSKYHAAAFGLSLMFLPAFAAFVFFSGLLYATLR